MKEAVCSGPGFKFLLYHHPRRCLYVAMETDSPGTSAPHQRNHWRGRCGRGPKDEQPLLWIRDCGGLTLLPAAPDTPSWRTKAGALAPEPGQRADSPQIRTHVRGTRAQAASAWGHTPSLSVRRAHCTQTPHAFAGRRAPSRCEGGDLGGGRSWAGVTSSGPPRRGRSGRVGPPAFPASQPGPCAGGCLRPGALPRWDLGPSLLLGLRQAKGSWAAFRAPGPTHEKSSRRVLGRGSRRAGRPASFGASPNSPKLSSGGAGRLRVGPSICWACLGLSRTHAKILSIVYLALSPRPEPSLCHPYLASPFLGLQIALFPSRLNLEFLSFSVTLSFFPSLLSLVLSFLIH